MKKLIEIVIISALLITPILAQENNSQPYDMKAKKEVTKSGTIEDAVLKIEITERMITTGVVIFEVLILLLILYYWKKTREDKKVENKKVYKNNIKAIRNERIIPFMDEKISYKRRELQSKIRTKNINGTSIAKLSKKLDVAKGELFLAAKIQQLQNQIR